MHKYLYIVRVRRVWYALAGITYNTDTACVARAMADLSAAGVDVSKGVVRSAATVEAQKNYAGQHPGYREVLPPCCPACGSADAPVIEAISKIFGCHHSSPETCACPNTRALVCPKCGGARQ